MVAKKKVKRAPFKKKKMKPKIDINSWFFQEGCETKTSYEVFQKYLDLPLPRILAQVAAGKGRSQSRIRDWSSGNKWIERAHARDKYEADFIKLNNEKRDLLFTASNEELIEGARNTIVKAASLAADRLKSLINSDDDRVALKACTEILDRIGVISLKNNILIQNNVNSTTVYDAKLVEALEAIDVEKLKTLTRLSDD